MESVRQMSAGEEELETAGNFLIGYAQVEFAKNYAAPDGNPGQPLQHAALGHNDIAKLRG